VKGKKEKARKHAKENFCTRRLLQPRFQQYRSFVRSPWPQLWVLRRDKLILQPRDRPWIPYQLLTVATSYASCGGYVGPVQWPNAKNGASVSAPGMARMNTTTAGPSIGSRSSACLKSMVRRESRNHMICPRPQQSCTDVHRLSGKGSNGGATRLWTRCRHAV
jgi:hypothetical protein